MKRELCDKILKKANTKAPGIYSHSPAIYGVGIDGEGHRRLFIYDYEYAGIYEFAYGFMSHVGGSTLGMDTFEIKDKIKLLLKQLKE